jgi:Flp pilus assembly protein TadD
LSNLGMDSDDTALERVTFISIAETSQRRIGDFILDPAVLLPVELPPGAAAANTKELSWEAIVSGMLLVLAYDAKNTDKDYYRKFILAVKPEILDEFTHLGITTARNGDFPSAVRIFRSLAGLFPANAYVEMNLALVYDQAARKYEGLEKTGPAEEYHGLAFEAYKRALAADPSEPVIHYNFAFFYLHQRSFEKAREHFAEFLRSSTDAGMRREAERIVKEIDSQGLMDGMFKKAFDFVRMGKEEEGIACIRLFLEAHPDVPNAWFILGWGLRRLARYAEGKEAFLKALELGAAYPDIQNELAICLMELGELSESKKSLQAALAQEPENTKIISNLGIVSMKMGNPTEASGFFRTVLELEPGDPVAARYLKILS